MDRRFKFKNRTVWIFVVRFLVFFDNVSTFNDNFVSFWQSFDHFTCYTAAFTSDDFDSITCFYKHLSILLFSYVASDTLSEGTVFVFSIKVLLVPMKRFS